MPAEALRSQVPSCAATRACRPATPTRTPPRRRGGSPSRARSCGCSSVSACTGRRSPTRTTATRWAPASSRHVRHRHRPGAHRHGRGLDDGRVRVEPAAHGMGPPRRPGEPLRRRRPGRRHLLRAQVGAAGAGRQPDRAATAVRARRRADAPRRRRRRAGRDRPPAHLAAGRRPVPRLPLRAAGGDDRGDGRPHNRPELVAVHGYDIKYAMHARAARSLASSGPTTVQAEAARQPGEFRYSHS